MQCERVRLELQAYLGGEIAPGERAKLEAHLTTCQVCSEEARAMKGFGDVLRRGLNDWIDQGSVPPGLRARIEVQIRPRKKAWWKNWQTSAGLVAAAAVFMLLFTTQPERMASIPFLGMLASQFIAPDFELTVLPGPVQENISQKPARTVQLQNVVAEKHGVTLTVNLIEQVGNLTHLQYTVNGIALNERLSDPVSHPKLSGPKGPVTLLNFSADRRAGAVVFNAYHDTVAPGQALTLTIEGLPVGDQVQQGPWQVTFSN